MIDDQKKDKQLQLTDEQWDCILRMIDNERGLAEVSLSAQAPDYSKACLKFLDDLRDSVSSQRSCFLKRKPEFDMLSLATRGSATVGLGYSPLAAFFLEKEFSS